MSYPKTRVRGSRLLEAAFILAIAELTRRLHQAYEHAYDQQAADWVLPQNYAQDRSDLKIDRDVFKNKKPRTYPGLPPCVKDYLSKFFDPALLGAITWEHGVPLYVPGGNDNDAFTLDDHIYFGTGKYTPLNGISNYEIELIGHEVTHSRQYRQNGSLRQKAKYLAESAIKGVAGSAIGGATLGWELSYWGNKYESEARDMEKRIRGDLIKNGNPCP